MKLSKGTLDILKNFSNINPSIAFKEGQELSTLSIQRNILSRAVVEEKFPKDFAIYDLGEFLSGLSLFDNPDFDFANDNYVIIKDSKCQSRYFFADPSTITSPPAQRAQIPSEDVSFVVAWSDLNNLIRAASIYSVDDLAVIGDGKDIKLVVRDKKNDTSNNYSVKVGTTDAKFTFNFKVEYLKLLPADYGVTISKQNAALFRDANRDLEYLIALEPDSVYNG
jgi:hypothetical protein